MARFFRRLAPGVFDEEDLRFRTGELAEFTAAAAREYGFDPARVCAVGFSNGANMAASLLLLAPRVLRDAVLFSPVLPLDPEQRPDLRGVSVFIGAAEDDTVADPASTRKLERVLLEAGADVMTRWKRGGHTITAQDVTAARDWLLT
jgi:predicted esterase